MSFETLAKKAVCKVLPNLKYLWQTKLRRCRCCEKRSLIISLSGGEEYKLCVRCRANLRYEMLATCVRARWSDFSQIAVVEFDPRSPLRGLLSSAGSYVMTYFKVSDARGSIRPDGARCEDITALTFDDNSVDLMVSSDVLEHVPDLHKAFTEMARVLRPGGVHFFTVPTRQVTKIRAEILNGEIKHLAAPEYHSDPLNPEGILTFWDFGLDAPEIFGNEQLSLSIIAGPEGKDQRVVWEARKR